MKSKRISFLPEAKLRRQLPPVLDELGVTDRQRLLEILPLLGADGKARLSECLKTAFPGKAQADALKAFKVFRSAVNKAADTVGLSLLFTTDSRKKTPPAGRFCWFEAEDTTEHEITQFSDQGTRDVDPHGVQNTGLLTDWRKLLAGPTPVRIFVSYAHANAPEAKKLIAMVKTVWKAALPPGDKLPDPDWIWVDWEEVKPSEEWKKKILAAMDRSHIGLFLVSVEALASDFIYDVELRHFLTNEKPILPVRLGVLPDADAPRLKEFLCRQFAELPGRKENLKLCYTEVHRDKNRSPLFAAIVLQGIVAAIAEWRGLAGTPTSQPAPPEKLTVELSDNRLTYLVDEAADVAHGDEDKLFISGNARRISLGELEKFDLSKSLPEGKVGPAIEQLQEWLDDAEGSPFFAILGELGIGKTTTLKCFTRRLLAARKQKPSLPLPIFVDLRLYHNDDTRRKVPTLEELLTEVIRHHWKSGGTSPLTAQEIVDAVQKGGALIIFDGLDEKMVAFNREQSGQFIRELWRILPPPPREEAEEKTRANPAKKEAFPTPPERRGRMILSCRSHYFKDVITQNAMLLGEYREGLHAADYEVCVILPFNDQQVRAYLKIVLGSETRADDAIAFFKKVHNLEELSRRPFLLAQIVPQLAQLEARQMRGERILGITLYEDLASRWLARDSGKTQFTDAHKLEMMEQLAADMALEGARAWPWDKVEKWLGRFLAVRPEVALFYRGHSPDALHQDFRTATFVLRPDDSRADFRFAHSSLGEFFHARRLVRALDEGALEPWQIPMPSLETLDFAGQFLALEPRPERLAAWERVFAQGGKGAVVALRLWLIALGKGYPQPAPAVADLRGAALEGWEIAGAAADRPLCLRGARLEGASLHGARLKFVDLSEAQFGGADAVRARFEECRLDGAQFGAGGFSGAIFRHCSAARLTGAEAGWRSAQWIGCDLTDAVLPTGVGTEAALARCRRGAEEFSLPAGLPPDLEARLLDAHHGPVTCVAWSPDGRQLLSGSADNTLRVWDATSGQCRLTLQGHANSVLACAWSPDGRQLLSGSHDKTLRVWDAASGQCLRLFALLPGGETAALEPRRILAATPGAWPFLAWHLPDPDHPRLLPAEFFGELPKA